MSRPDVKHYKAGAIEPIDFIASQELNFNLGNVVKYVTRCNHKGTKREDLQKAIDYINFELQSMKDPVTVTDPFANGFKNTGNKFKD